MLMRTTKSLVKNALDHSAHLFGPHRGQSQHPRLWILMYHRVLPKSDPRYTMEEPGMVVEPETFAQQMDFVKQHFTPLPLQYWLQRRHSGQALPPKSCAVTFDDGWLDNYQYAFPILREKEIPATLFAVSHMIGTHETFWPNRLSHLLDHKPETLDALNVVLNGSTLSPPVGIDKRARLSNLVARLKHYPDHLIHEWLDDIDPAPVGTRSMMNWDELRSMLATGLIDIGSHSCHHYRLRDDLAPEVIAREITDSKYKLEKELERPVRVFCYPNGDSSPLARDLVARHYEAAVTTRGGINSAMKLKPFELLRVGIHEDRCKTAAKFASRLANWY